jgi:ribonuclease BN (tRNA processing enzyme)
METDRVKGQTDRPVRTGGEWTWTVLGAGTILPRAGYGSAGHALRHRGGPVTLFDCGPGTVRAFGPAGIGIGDVERVFISHFHPDHWLDLLALAFARRNPTLGELPALEIVGPRGLAGILERGANLVGSKSWLRFERTTVVEIDPSACTAPLVRGPVRFTWVATGHTPEGVAWRADLGGDGASVAYTGDTGENPVVADLARGVSLFVCECSFRDAEAMELHLTPSSAGRLAARSGCARLLLTHFYPPVDPEAARTTAAALYPGPIELSRDGSAFPI